MGPSIVHIRWSRKHPTTTVLSNYDPATLTVSVTLLGVRDGDLFPYFSARNHYKSLWLSTVLLIVLAVFGSGLDGVSVAGFDVFPFILYLIPHSILVFFLVNRHSEYLFDIPSPLVAVLLFALYAVGSSFLAIGASSVLKVMVIVVASISVAAFAYWSVGDAWSLRRYVGILQLLALLGLAIAVIEITTKARIYPLANGSVWMRTTRALRGT